MTKVYTAAGIQELDFAIGPNELPRGATWVRGEGQINPPVGDVDVYIAQSCEIAMIAILTGEAAGSCVIDVWRAPHGSFPPDVSDTIFASGKPSISGGVAYFDSVLAGVSTLCAAGDTLRFHLDSSSTFTHVSIFLVLRKTES